MATSILLLLLTLALLQSATSTETEHFQNLLTTSQYYFIPNSSYLQFRVSSAQLGHFSASSSISEIQGLLYFNLTNSNLKNVSFNMIVMPPLAPQDGSFAFYNCYMKAAFEGLNNINCSIANTTVPDGNCTDCVQAASNKTYASACVGCNTSFKLKILQNLDFQTRSLNQTANSNLLIIIDNTNVLSLTGKYLEMNLEYKVSLELNQSDETVILFFLIMLVVIIGITLIIAVYLSVKIKNVGVVIDNYIKVD